MKSGLMRRGWEADAGPLFADKGGTVQPSARMAKCVAETVALVKRWPGRDVVQLSKIAGFRDPRRTQERLKEAERAGLVVRRGTHRNPFSGKVAALWFPA